MGGAAEDRGGRSGRVVVVGASLAGATAAVTLRQLGHEGPVVLVGDEPHLPYERPGLSKDYLVGAVSAASLRVHPQGTYDELGIELRLGTAAAALDVDGRRVVLADGQAVAYDEVVLATGSSNVVPDVPGMTGRGVHQLRGLDEADALRAAAASTTSAVVVGMGFIGCEAAACLRGLGLDVTVVDLAERPLHAQVGAELSAVVRGWHEEHGVRLLPGTGVDRFEVGADGAVEAVRLSDGRVLPTGLVVVGVGARPATGWLQGCRLRLEQGAVAVDEAGRSSVPGVWAAGDVAAVWDAQRGRHVRSEHYRGALDQGARVAHALLDLPLPAAQPAWFWSDQYEHVLHLAGTRSPGSRLVVRPAPYTAFYLDDGVLSAVGSVDSPRDFRRALPLLGRAVDPLALADPAVDLRQLRAGRVSA